MIWESSYWKNDLLKLTKKLKKRSKQRTWPDASNALAEKEIMIGAFISRKLFDSKKTHSKFENHEMKIIKVPSNGQKIHLMQRLSPDRFFDFANAVVDTLKFRILCNQVIHSYIFILITNERGLVGFWVASDFDKFKFMYFVDINTFCSHLLKIGNYWPKLEMYKYDAAKEDYIVTHK
jgi:hypothetical protein